MKFSLIFIVTIFVASCVQGINNNKMSMQNDSVNNSLATATFAAGCFWCVEAVFEQLNGVHSVVSGYTGGTSENPTYEEVSSGKSGHAEAVRISYDPEVITYLELLEVFWKTHDPTTLNRQGADVGPQYRSAVFYHNEEQKKLAEEMKQALNDAGIWNSPIVTVIDPLDAFHEAEDYHQDYYMHNSDKPYCSFVITPKLEKFREIFSDKLKETN